MNKIRTLVTCLCIVFQGAKKADPKGGSKGGKAAPGKAKKEGGGKAKKKVMFKIFAAWFTCSCV